MVQPMTRRVTNLVECGVDEGLGLAEVHKNRVRLVVERLELEVAVDAGRLGVVRVVDELDRVVLGRGAVQHVCDLMGRRHQTYSVRS